MSRYQVIARGIWIYEAFIEAEDDQAAKEMAHEMEEQEFEYLEGDWEITEIHRLPPPKEDMNKNQLTLF